MHFHKASLLSALFGLAAAAATVAFPCKRPDNSTNGGGYYGGEEPPANGGDGGDSGGGVYNPGLPTYNATGVPVPTLGDLPWNDWNFISTTDTHGWQAGHGDHYQEQFSADWADFAVFVAKLKEKAAAEGKELFVVDSGDTHDGTTLSDSSAGPVDGYFTQPMMKKVDYDILTIGNHELYVTGVANDVAADFAPYWGEKYLSSNVYLVDPVSKAQTPIGKKYRSFTGSKGTRVLSYGFLYNFTGNSNASVVTSAEYEIAQPWFSQSLADHEADLYLLAGHMPIRSSKTKTLYEDWVAVYKAIRAVKPTTPIVILGGHTHIRDFVSYGTNCYAIEGGRFMETVGFLSLSKDGKEVDRRYLDSNKATFNYHVGYPVNVDIGASTPLGQSLRGLISDAIAKTNYTVAIGVAPQDYYLNRVAITDPSSLYYLLTQNLASIIQRADKPNPAYVIINAGSQRTDIFKGSFTANDASSVSPFDDRFLVLPNIKASTLQQIKPVLESYPAARRRRRDAVAAAPCNATLGYVTTDDLSATSPGDDTFHCPIPYVPVTQNNIYSPPLADSVDPNALYDLVFYDFIEQQVVNALNSLGGNYSKGQATYYVDSSFNAMAIWFKYAAKYWAAP
ncbi:Metallo-dependent phosphatase-like protein [Zopfochytrium polystomum]|nr:Metallo-dependent phosphatase-like protein [Zopfochytrium polystomum]